MERFHQYDEEIELSALTANITSSDYINGTSDGNGNGSTTGEYLRVPLLLEEVKQAFQGGGGGSTCSVICRAVTRRNTIIAAAFFFLLGTVLLLPSAASTSITDNSTRNSNTDGSKIEIDVSTATTRIGSTAAPLAPQKTPLETPPVEPPLEKKDPYQQEKEELLLHEETTVMKPPKPLDVDVDDEDDLVTPPPEPLAALFQPVGTPIRTFHQDLPVHRYPVPPQFPADSQMQLSADGTRLIVAIKFDDEEDSSMERAEHGQNDNENENPFHLRSKKGYVQVWDWHPQRQEWTKPGMRTSTDHRPESTNLAWDYGSYTVAMSADGSRVAIGGLLQSSHHSDHSHNENKGKDAPTSITRYSGQVLVLEWSPSLDGGDDNNNAGSWIQVGDAILEPFVSVYLGISLALSEGGARIVVGCPTTTAITAGEVGQERGWEFDDCPGHGHVRIFDYNRIDKLWIQAGPDILPKNTTLNSQPEEFDGNDNVIDNANTITEGCMGHTVAMSSNGLRIVVGATERDDGGWAAASVYDWKTTAPAIATTTVPNHWQQTGSSVRGKAQYDDFAQLAVVLSLDGTRFALSGVYLGHTGNQNGRVKFHDEGHVQVYALVGTTVRTLDATATTKYDWEQLGDDVDSDYDIKYDSVDDPEHMLFGGSLALSANGSRVAVGSVSFADEGQIGKVRIFDWMPPKKGAKRGHWRQVGADIEGITNDDLDVGYRLAMSADGTRVVAAFNHGNATDDVLSSSIGTFDYQI